MLQGGGFSTVILLDFLSPHHPSPHVFAQSSNILWHVPDFNYLYAFQCPPSGLGLLTKPHHVAAALLLCRTQLHVHSIWTFPLMEAFPESECVSEGGWSLAEGARCPDEPASALLPVVCGWSVIPQ